MVTASTDLIFYGVGVGGSILIMSFEHNYYFVNCIPINASCRLKEKENGVFFSDKIDDLGYMFNHHPEMHM